MSLLEIREIHAEKAIEKGGKIGYIAEIALLDYGFNDKVKRYYVNAHSFDETIYGVSKKSIFSVVSDEPEFYELDHLQVFDSREEAIGTRFEPYVLILKNMIGTLQTQEKTKEEILRKKVVL